MLARLRVATAGAIERLDAATGEGSAGGACREHLHRATAARREIEFVVIPNMQRTEVHIRAEIPGDLRRQRIIRRGKRPVAQPHAAIRHRAVLARVEAAAVHRIHRAAREGAEQFRRHRGHTHARDFQFTRRGRRQLIAEGIVMPGARGHHRQKRERDAPARRSLVAIAHDESVARVVRIFVAEEGRATVRRRDPHEPVARSAESRGVKARDVRLVCSQPRERELRRPIVRRAVKELRAQLPAPAPGGQIIRPLRHPVVIVGDVRPRQTPVRTAFDIRPRRIEDHRIDRRVSARVMQADLVRVGPCAADL